MSSGRHVSNMIIFSICTINLTIHLVSLTLDQWMIKMDTSELNSTIRHIGVWNICLENNRQQQGPCLDSVLTIKFHIQENTGKEPEWLHLTRFLLVLSVLFVGFGVLIELAVIATQHPTRSALPLNLVGTLITVPVLICILPQGRVTFKGLYFWSTSYILACVGTTFNLFVYIVYIIKYLYVNLM